MYVMTTLFEELFKPDSRAYPKECKWIKSSDDVYTAEFELAGFSRKDVKITVNNEILRVEANKEDRNKKFSIALNDLVCPSDVTSNMSNGLLKITMPKKQIKETISIQIK
jgi:HSP20 family molecular chaperone IbpA